MKKRVFITGVAGFLGSHLAKRYLDLGCVVHGVDNFCSSKMNSVHLKALKQHGAFMVRHYDVCNAQDPQALDVFPGMTGIISDGLDNDGGYDIILNFACPASPPIYQKIPIQTMLTCTLGMYHVLEGAKQSYTNPIVIHASTSEIYGDPEISPQSEAYLGRVHSWGPRACYDEGKRAAEALCYDYRNLHNVDVRLIRIFNTYGPQMDPDDGRVVTNFVKQALKNTDITVYGNGDQTRSFCYVDDLVSGIMKLASLSKDKSPDHPINLGNPSEFTILELARKVLEMIPESRSKIDFVALPPHDPTQRKPDISQAKKFLKGWEPKISLEEGLSRLIPYMKDHVR